MKLISANRPGNAIVPVRSLTAAESDALVCHYTEGVESASVQDFLSRTWHARHWLACECQRDGRNPPQLFVRRTAADEFRLMRMADRPSHHSRCPYAQLSAFPSGRDGRGLPPSPLAALLCRWFGAARLNVLYPYDLSDGLKRQYASLREVSRSLELAPGRRLYEHSQTHWKGLAALLKRAASDPAVEAGAISAVYLAVVSTLAPAELRAALVSGEVDFSDLLSEPTAQSPDRLPGSAGDAGPYAVLFAFARGAAGCGVGVASLFAHPVFSHRQLVPVDSPHERRTLNLLLDLQRTLLDSHHIVIAIRKTLPGEALRERGVAFQVLRVGPNGRPTSPLDVLCVDASAARGMPMAADTDDVAYHYVDGMHVEGLDDSEFSRRVLAHVIQGVEGPVAREALMHDEAR